MTRGKDATKSRREKRRKAGAIWQSATLSPFRLSNFFFPFQIILGLPREGGALVVARRGRVPLDGRRRRGRGRVGRGGGGGLARVGGEQGRRRAQGGGDVERQRARVGGEGGGVVGGGGGRHFWGSFVGSVLGVSVWREME